MPKQKSRSRVSADAIDEDDWVVVQKQKVIILIPSLPMDEQLIVSNNTIQEIHQPEMPRTSIDTEPPVLGATTSPKESVPEKGTFLLEAPECVIPDAEAVDLLPRSSGPRSASEYAQMNSLRVRNSNHGLRPLRLCKETQVNGDAMPLFSQSMRAIKIEKKIRKAGGLSCWLISLGLERFVKIFQQKKVNKFQLASLNMNKLKDMGAFAVGPRRKLLHALDCLCQPYCFEHVRISSSL